MGETTYTLSAEPSSSKKHKRRSSSKKRHRRGKGKAGSGSSSEQEDATADGANSLTYSATSSIASSAAGESTDSSFADIMRVLDLQDDNELAAYMRKEGVVDPVRYAQLQKRHLQVSNASVAGESLVYSTDGDSALGGEHLLQTITGQPSDSFGPDGGGLRSTVVQNRADNEDDILFAPAEPTELRGKTSKRHRHRSGSHTSSSGTPKSKNQRRSSGRRTIRDKTTSSSRSNNLHRSDSSNSIATPPPVPPPRHSSLLLEDEDVWYAKWWMCGFTDAFHDLVPKR